MADPRVVVVGAGPAGVRAAETLADAGLRPVVIEEGERDGGQIYRRQPPTFRRSYGTLYGTEASRARAVHRAFEALRERIEYRPRTLAWGLRESRLELVRDGVASSLAFDSLIVCPGATDRLMPVPGWTRAGVYSLGGAQTALKSQACAIGRRVAFIGTGPLLYLVAAQYDAAGARVAALLDTSPDRLRLKALSRLAARPGALAKGLAMTARLRAAGVDIETGITPVEITGDESGVTGIAWRTARGEARTVACDAVAIGYHLRPETQLADLARCRFRFDRLTRQWLPEIDADGRSSVSGVYLAGDGARVVGADAAEAAGRLAALAVLADAGRNGRAAEMARLRARLAKHARFAEGIAIAFPWPAAAAAELPDETVVCRCEMVTAGALREAVAEQGAVEVNRAKALRRVGMGRCQSRFCANAAAEVIAAATGLPVEEVGRLRGQAPVKPLVIATDREEAAE